MNVRPALSDRFCLENACLEKTILTPSIFEFSSTTVSYFKLLFFQRKKQFFELRARKEYQKRVEWKTILSDSKINGFMFIFILHNIVDTFFEVGIFKAKNNHTDPVDLIEYFNSEDVFVAALIRIKIKCSLLLQCYNL